jgi:hypothetical protein
MSGAALWAGGRVVGVVSEHHPADGAARLAAARIDRTPDRLDPAALSALRDLLPSLPERSALLPDVTAPEDPTLKVPY